MLSLILFLLRATYAEISIVAFLVTVSGKGYILWYIGKSKLTSLKYDIQVTLNYGRYL